MCHPIFDYNSRISWWILTQKLMIYSSGFQHRGHHWLIANCVISELRSVKIIRILPTRILSTSLNLANFSAFLPRRVDHSKYCECSMRTFVYNTLAMKQSAEWLFSTGLHYASKQKRAALLSLWNL